MFQLKPEGRVASHNKQLFIIYLKSKFTWASCIFMC